MKDTELKQLRDKHLYQAYVKALQEHPFRSMEEAVEFVRKSPAPMYYISATEIAQHIGRRLSRISLIKLNEHSFRRANKLWDDYLEYRKENPDSKLTIEQTMEILVERPAPEFYLSAGRAKHIIVYERKKVRERLGR